MMTRTFTFGFACALFSLLAGCDEISEQLDPSSCTPGRVKTCPCVGGVTGTQRCNDDGEGYDRCMCSHAEDDDQMSDPDDQPDPDFPPDPEVDPDPNPGPDPDVTPEPDPIPDVTSELRSAQVRVVVVGATLAAEVNADWRATGADNLTVELQVKSQLTYRAWTPLLRNQPADHFATASLQVTQGERRFDFRIVARDGAGNEWPSEAIIVQ